MLSLSAGSGHVRAAESLREEAHNSYPDAIVEHRDIIEFVHKPLKLIYRDFYVFMTKNAPLVWGYLYKTANSPMVRETIHATSHIQTLLAAGLARFIDVFKPDMIVCTHFVCAEIATSILKERGMATPVAMVITDYQIHHLWMVEGVYHYFVATQTIKKDLIAAGVAAERITASGIPVSTAVIATERSPHLYEHYVVEQGRPIVLALSGGFGLQDTSTIVQTLMASKLPLQICAVAGSNKALKEKLEALQSPSHITVRIYDFVRAIHELYALADVVISKAGGLTVTECITRGVPLIITEPLPGQEAANANFLQTHKAALQIKKTPDVLNKIHRILTNAALRGELTKNMKKIARPYAARAILEQVIKE